MKIPEFLYQYTSIDALALILENMTLRFTSLEYVDDPLEMENSNVNKFGKFAYVSCWTSSKIEKIPFWKMYTNNCGIRIKVSGNKLFNSLKQDPDYLIKELNKGREGDKIILADKDFILHPKKVSYYENIDDLNVEILKNDSNLLLSGLGERKLNDWKFQDEFRFAFYTMPSYFMDDDKKIKQVINNYNTNNFKVPRNVDIPVDENEFVIEEITMGSEVSKAQEIIIKALAEKYKLTCHITESIYKR